MFQLLKLMHFLQFINHDQFYSPTMIKKDETSEVIDQDYESTIINGQNNTLDSQNIIRITRHLIKDMTEEQRLQKAKAHVIDAFNYRRPRPHSQSLDTPLHFKRLYALQSSAAWQWLLFLLGYTFMYLVIMDKQSYVAKIAVESTILFIFWFDTLMATYIKQFDTIGKHRQSTFFKFRFVLISLMTIDLIIFIILPGYDSRPIRPFRILRCLVPMLYDPEKKKTFFSLISAYKDVLVYFIFFAIIICGWALIGSRALTFDTSYVDPNFPQNVDPYKNNYSDLGKMIFVVYVLATYDSYPDNDILAVQNFQPNYIYFIVFIFANMFLFSSIPGSLIYIKFRQTRSKIILIDQIRQQHSLILAFVTLADSQKELSTKKLIQFLSYLYRYKIRFVQYITDICLKMDDNNSKSIQVNQFMQLSKIILSNKAMFPPAFDDIQAWVNFRKFFNVNLHLKQIVRHWLFELIVSVIIILSFINAIFFIYNYSPLVQTFDSIFVWIFVTQLLLRIIAIGPQNFFSDRWNNLDTFLVAVGVTFFFVPIKNNADSIVRMSRIFRIASLLRLISHSNFMEHYRFQTLQKLKKIFSVILQILPIILKFMPLFLVFFYVYAIVGMQIFYNSYATTGSSSYNQYQQFSSFRTFIQAQYIMVQVLTEAGWSMIAYDHSWRNPQYFGYIMVYFCIMHITIVYIIATLIKGIFWEVFFTVNGIFEERQAETKDEELKELQNQQLANQLAQINKLIASDQYIDPNTILKRQLYENKLDKEIFQKLKQAKDKLEEEKKKVSASRKQLGSKKELVTKLMDNYKIELNDLDLSEDIKSKYGKQLSESGQHKTSIKFLEDKMDFDEIEEVAQEDFESEIQQIFDQVILNPKARYSYIVGQNRVFTQFLKSKFVKPQSMIKDKYFNLHQNPLYNKQSMLLHIYEIHAMLNIETSKREQKSMIIQSLVEQQIIKDQIVADSLIKKKLNEKIFNIDTNGTLRKMFLSETNQDLIKKFQVEYFSDLYGYSFKQINKMTLEPLLKVEATLTYSLRNIMRYPQINNTQFFEMLTNIQDQISNKLLQRGSLFKFVYKLDALEDIWFSIQYKHQQEMRVHFIKTGVWASYNQMENNQVYYARDVFKCDSNQKDKQVCQKFLKRFYQSFEGLAFSLLDEKKFFETNPQSAVYDLYIQCFNAEQTRRFINRQNEISKIMVVILSKEQDRKELGEERLPYSLTDLITKPKRKHQIQFTFDDTQNQTFDKLKNFAAQDHQKIVESQGLPFAYIINLMRQILDIINIYGENFIYQIEKVLNEQYETMSKVNLGEQGQIIQDKKEVTKKLKHMRQSISMFI